LTRITDVVRIPLGTRIVACVLAVCDCTRIVVIPHYIWRDGMRSRPKACPACVEHSRVRTLGAAAYSPLRSPVLPHWR
jgi:hypothetical protein